MKYDACNIINHIILHQHIFRIPNNNIFDPLLFDSLFITGVLVLCVVAFVVPMHRTVPTRTAFSCHIDTTFTTEQFGCQQIVVLGLVPCGGFFVFLQLLLHLVEQIRWNNLRYTIIVNNISKPIFTDVTPIFQHIRYNIDGYFCAE